MHNHENFLHLQVIDFLLHHVSIFSISKILFAVFHQEDNEPTYQYQYILKDFLDKGFIHFPLSMKDIQLPYVYTIVNDEH
jgi:hypothetical protein